MSIALRTLVLACGSLLALAALPDLAEAQAPVITPDPDPDFAGRYVVSVVTPPILDYSRTTMLEAGGSVTTTMLVEDVRGRIRGTTTTSGPVINDEGRLRGRVSTKQGLPFVQLRTIEVGTVGEDKIRSVAKLAAHLEGWGPDATLVGQLKQHYCAIVTDPIRKVKKKICTDNAPAFNEPVPDAGSWEVRAALDRSGDRIIGAASISTGFGGAATRRTVDATVSGTVSSSSGLATVKLKPMDPAILRGSVTLIGPLVEDADGQLYFSSVHEVKGKLLGQAFDEVFDSVP